MVLLYSGEFGLPVEMANQLYGFVLVSILCFIIGAFNKAQECHCLNFGTSSDDKEMLLRFNSFGIRVRKIYSLFNVATKNVADEGKRI